MRKKLPGVLALVVAVAAAAMVVGCGGDDDEDSASAGGGAAPRSPEVEKKVEAAEREGELKLQFYPAVSQALTDELVAGFKEYYGIDIPVNVAFASDGAEVASQLVQTARAGRDASTDLAFNSYTGVLFGLSENLYQPVDWSWAPNIAGKEADVLEVADDAGKAEAVRVTTFVNGFTYNTEILSEDEVPRTREALLDVPNDVPIATTAFGTGFEPAFTDAQWGEQRAFDWTRAFAPEIDGFVACEPQRVASGEFGLLAYDCGVHEAIALKEKGAPVDFVVPSDVPFVNFQYAQVPRHAAHPAAAELFVNWWLSPQAQRIMYDEMAWDLHTLEGSESAELIESLRDPLLVDVAFARRNLETIQRAGEETEKIFKREAD